MTVTQGSSPSLATLGYGKNAFGVQEGFGKNAFGVQEGNTLSQGD